MSLPKFLKPYFWDVDFQKLNSRDNKYFILEKILEYGDKKDVKWAFNNFSKNDIKEVVLSSRCLSLKTANFWGLFLNLNKKDILCLNKQLTNKQKTAWRY
jgi:hypothetical protein